MHLELITEAAEFPRIKEAWGRLCDELGEEACAFASYEWYETWWRHYAAGAKLNLFALWDGARLVGVAPLMLRPVTMHGLSATAVCFIENSQSLNNEFIVLPAVREFFLREVLGHLFRQGAGWQTIILKNLPGGSANCATLVQILDETGRKWRRIPTFFDSPYLIPSGSWDDYLAGRTTRTRKALRNIRNNIHKAGAVAVRNIRSWEEFLAVKDEAFAVARQSWAEGEQDSLASAANAEFFHDLARAAAQKGWLSLWTLSLDGRIIAIEFHLKAYGKDHAMRGHYLPEFASLSPGTYLELMILKDAFEAQERVRVYDFCGSFESYKKKWTESYVPHHDVEIFGDTAYARLIAFQETVLIPLLRRALPQDFWNNRFFKLCGINTRRREFK